MHNSEAPDHRCALVVERDWINDVYVVTRSLVAADGSVSAATRSEYACSLYEATEVEEIVSGLAAAR